MKKLEFISLDLAKVIGGVIKKLRKKQDDLLLPYGLSNFHAGYISNLERHGELSMADLTDLSGVDKANTTRVVKDLLDKQIVEKQGGERKFKLNLTQKGKTIATEFKKRIEKFMQKVFSNFTVDEKNTLCKLLDKLFNSIKIAVEG